MPSLVSDVRGLESVEDEFSNHSWPVLNTVLGQERQGLAGNKMENLLNAFWRQSFKIIAFHWLTLTPATPLFRAVKFYDKVKHIWCMLNCQTRGIVNCSTEHSADWLFQVTEADSSSPLGHHDYRRCVKVLNKSHIWLLIGRWGPVLASDWLGADPLSRLVAASRQITDYKPGSDCKC